MEIKIKTKTCPGCSKEMKATKVDHTMKTLAYIEWECDSCNRQFGFYYSQDTKEL